MTSITFPDVILGVLTLQFFAIGWGLIRMWGESQVIKERLSIGETQNSAEHIDINTKLTGIRDNHLPHIYEVLTRLEAEVAHINSSVDRILKTYDLG